MSSTNKSASIDEANIDLHAIMDDIASLKHDLATLAGHWKTDAVNATGGAVTATGEAARTAANQISEEAARLYGNLASQGGRSVKALSHQVEEQPVISLLIAFALGFVGSRLLSR